MINKFTTNPVKIKFIDIKNGNCNTTYVFVGIVDKKIENELTKLEHNVNYKSSVLKSFYGPGWRTILGVDKINSVGRHVKGGDEGFEIDDDLIKELDKDLNGSDPVKSNPNAEITEVPEIINNVDFLAEKAQTVKVEHNGGVKFITNIQINPTDNIFELKEKLYVATGIPIYRQHLWFKYHERSYPLNYTVNINKHTEYIDIERLIAFFINGKSDVLESIDDIPVEIKYYNNKDFINIIASDTFELLGNIYNNYATNEFSLVDLNDIVDTKKLSVDKYQLEIIYYGFIMLYFPMISLSVFHDYIKNESMIAEIYPDLMRDSKQLMRNFEKEAIITNAAYRDNSHIDKKLFSAVTSTTVSINNYTQDVKLVLSLRNLFDLLELNETITYCKANIFHDNKNIILRKSFMKEKEPRDILPINSLLIKVKTNADTNENIRIVLFKNGNYIVKTEWREENHMNFDKVIAITSAKTNPIIKMINNFGDNVKYHKITLPELTKKNTSFTETTISFYYDDDITEAKFDVFKSILDDCYEIGILTPKENLSLGIEYFFNKGMYLYDATRIEKSINIDNYYEYLSSGAVKQKWNTVFVRTRLFQIINILSKLKITISGIRDDIEMDNFHMYLKAFLSIYAENTKNMKIAQKDMSLVKKNSLKSLRVQDPLLYDFKKIYKSNVIYAKICQKPHQPVILNNTEYEKLPSNDKSRALKYWNYTTQKPVWYSCPNPKYPFIKFHVKQHPKDFCIPCCKKIEMGENVNIKKQEIHNTCMDKHIYSGEKVNLTKGSHYIASYGKNIDVGRISRLPEHTLEPLFFDTYSINDGIDQECVTTDGYYLYGTEQNSPAIKNIGMMYILTNVLNLGAVEFINECGKRLKKFPDSFRALIDGKAGLYFTDTSDIFNTMLEIINPDTLVPLDHIPWNQLFINIAYYYFGINTILFEDTAKETIELILPKGLKSYNEMFPDSHKNIVVLHKKSFYYPVYLLNTEIFKRTGIVDTKVYLNESGLIAIIKSIVRKSLESQDFSTIKFYIELNAVKEFCSYSGLEIEHYYINFSNMCYAVVINDCYFPITPSYYSLEKDISLKFTHYIGENTTTFNNLKKLIDLFKKWNTYVSKRNGLDGILMYPDIIVEQWLDYNGDIIGFIFNNVNYYISNLKESAALKYADAPIQKLLYHPFLINKLICGVKQNKIKTGQMSKHTDNLHKSLYNYYIYEILLLHFIREFNSHRNTSLRNKLNMIISKTNFSNNVNELRKFIDNIDDIEDIHKIKNLINKFITVHHDKKQLITDISNTYFNFDKTALEVLRGKSIKDITNILTKIAAKFVKISNHTAESFPNIITVCESKTTTDYCSGSKLLINKKTLTELISIIASDAADPEKWKWIFNSAFISRSVDYFKFIKRDNEYITIEFVE